MKYIKEYNDYSIIFLDIDGVLRPTHSYIGIDEYGQLFVDRCVAALKYIIDNTNSKIVISSTWKSSGLSIMKEIWTKRNLPGDIIDITPNEVDIVDAGVVDYLDMVDRGLEIDQWIKNNNFTGKYIIIDDVKDFTSEQLFHYIKTDPSIGLTMYDADKAIKLL